MKTRTTFRPAAMVATGVIAMAGVAWTAGNAVGSAAASRFAPPASPMIATIDLEAVVQGLTERADKDAALKAEVAELQKRIDGVVAELESEKGKLEMAPEGPQKIAVAKAIREKAFRAEFERSYSQRLLNERKSEMLRELYMKIGEASKKLAQQNGYHVVLANDQGIEVPRGSEDAVTQAIAMKRMMYVDPSLDVTKDLITLMNNEYAAGSRR